MNFISTFEELEKLYEEADTKKPGRQKRTAIKERLYDDEAPLGRGELYPSGTRTKADYCRTDDVPGWWFQQGGTVDEWRKRVSGKKESLEEAADDEEIEIVDDEAVEDPEPKQTIIECAKCGALAIVDEVEVDEESDLVNVKDECKFCEEKEGYKIVGSVVPYEETEVAEDETVEDEAEEAEEAVEEVEEPGEELAEEDDIIDEDLADVARKVFDKSASVETQQRWEDELNDDAYPISDKRRAQLEKKFAQQRDWEERHVKTEACNEAYGVKLGRGKPVEEFDTLEAAIKNINDGMKSRSSETFVLYNGDAEMIWIDRYAERDGHDLGYTVSRHDDKSVTFDEDKQTLSAK